MTQAAKIIGTGLATTGLIGAGIGIYINNIALIFTCFINIILDILIIFFLLLEGKSVSKYPWAMPQLLLNSPPKPHAFANLPYYSYLKVWLNFFVGGGIAVSCWEKPYVEGVSLYHYYDVNGVLLEVSLLPINPFGG